MRQVPLLCLYFVVDRLASIGAMVWIGLNHLKDGRGWQWSDGTPLSLVNFTTGNKISWFILNTAAFAFHTS